MKIRMYTGGMAQTNAYLIGDDDNCILIDAPLGVDEWLHSQGASPSDVLLTHQHYDHVEGAAKIAEQGATLHAFAPYSQDLTLELMLRESGIPLTVIPYPINQLLENKNSITVKDWNFSLEHIPGHAPDSIVFIDKSNNIAFVGDTLFAGGIGRADLPGGNMQLLVSGIQKKLLTLPEETVIFPGHGPQSTISTEKTSNPYL